MRSFKQGEHIITQGAVGDQFFIILNGECSVTLLSQEELQAKEKYLRRQRWKGSGEIEDQDQKESVVDSSTTTIDPDFTGQVSLGFTQSDMRARNLFGDSEQSERFQSVSQRQEVAILGSGDFFGELALLRDDPRAATVTATEHTKCVTISRKVFTELQSAMQSFMETRRDSVSKTVSKK